MKHFTNKEFEERGLETRVAPGIFSFLSPGEIKEVRHAVRCAYPGLSNKDMNGRVVSIACSPTTAAGFVDRVNYAIKAMEAT